MALPSVMAASTTWPLPDCAASTNADAMPNAKSIPPPPKSPTKLSGGVGFVSFGPMACKAPDNEI